MMRLAAPLLAALIASSLADDEEDFREGLKVLENELSDDGTFRQQANGNDEDYQAMVDQVIAKYDDGTTDWLSGRRSAPGAAPGSQAVNESWYEDPRDSVVVPANYSSVQSWFDNQEWRYFTSPVGRPGSRTTTDVSIAYVTVRGGTGAKGAMVVSPGRAEPVHKYDETAHNFMDMGYSPIYVFTHRGQGESDRLIGRQSPQYVEGSRDFIHDIRHFTELVAAEMAASDEDKDKPLFLLCHSMGCGIATAYLIEEYEASRQLRYYAFAGAAPGIKPNTAPFPFSVAVGLGNVLTFIGRGQSDAPMQGGTFEGNHRTENFPTTCCTQSFTRFLMEKNFCQAYETTTWGPTNHSHVCLFGLTTRFVKEYFELYIDFTLQFMRVEAKKLTIPTLMQTAGNPATNDGLVLNDVTADFCANSVVNCVLTNYGNTSRHGLLGEIDSIRNPVIAEIDSHFQNNRDSIVGGAMLPPGIMADGEGCSGDLQCMSRRCDAHFAFDIFGGTCVAQETFLSGSRGHGASFMLALLAAAMVLGCF